MERAAGPISVILADDHPMFRAGIAMLLRNEPGIEVTAEANDGAEAVELARRHRADVVVMDLRMPGMDGIAAARALAEGDDRDRLTRVLALTVGEDDEMVLGALRAGASGFLLKRAAPGDLIDAIRRVAAGDAWIDPSVAGRVIAALASTAPARHPEEPVGDEAAVLAARLTAREREVLGLMARGCTNEEIRLRLSLSVATVKTHVSRVLMKIGAHDRAHAVSLAYRAGLVTPGT